MKLLLHKNSPAPQLWLRVPPWISILLAVPVTLWSLDVLAQAPQSVALHCVGHLGFGEGPASLAQSIAFETIIPFADGHFIALSAPDTDRIERLLYDAEVLVGSITMPKAMPQDIVWTRATSRKGGVVGLLIGSGGDITTLTIHSAAAGAPDRAFVLFSTATMSAYQGTCQG